MNFRIEVICVRDDGTEERREVRTFTKEELVMETLGLTIAEGKALLSMVQTSVVTAQATAYLAQHRDYTSCGKPYRNKEPRQSTANTVFGPVAVPNPRWHRCRCQTTGPLTFRPTAQWLTGHTSPELFIWRPNGLHLFLTPRSSIYYRLYSPSQRRSIQKPYANMSMRPPPRWNKRWAKRRRNSLQEPLITGPLNLCRMDR